MPVNMLNRGYTFIEALIVLGIGALLIASVVVFYARGVERNREQFEQVLISEDVRVNMDRIADVIRNARGVEGGSEWLTTAGDYELKILSNVDSDAALEEVRYYIDTANLNREVGGSQTTTLARSVRNASQSIPLFTYYDANGTALPVGSRTAEAVARVEITFVIDVNENTKPGAATVRTSAVPRHLLVASTTSEAVGEATIELPSNPATNSYARITLTDGETGDQYVEVRNVVELNEDRLRLFTDGSYVNINYLNDGSAPILGLIPGWYAWIGPLLLGKQGDTPYYKTDIVELDQLCLNMNLQTALADRGSCPYRTVSQGSLQKTYLPILVYLAEDGQEYYVRVISTTYALGDASPTPSPSPSPSPSGSPSPSPSGSGAPSISPSPSGGATPQQIAACSNYCQSQGYSSGSCDVSTPACVAKGKVHGTGGDSQCTPSAVGTCCCVP